ncbi:MAG: hypothetical protein J6568_04205 [Snodgrassella sp.]|nr:hypothetical protein [Snodgrassella sp.]
MNTVYPDTKIQLDIIHLVHNRLKLLSCKDDKEITRDLQAIYTTNALISLNYVSRLVI